jgi:hypothetical protein
MIPISSAGNTVSFHKCECTVMYSFVLPSATTRAIASFFALGATSSTVWSKTSTASASAPISTKYRTTSRSPREQAKNKAVHPAPLGSRSLTGTPTVSTRNWTINTLASWLALIRGVIPVDVGAWHSRFTMRPYVGLRRRAFNVHKSLHSILVWSCTARSRSNCFCFLKLPAVARTPFFGLDELAGKEARLLNPRSFLSEGVVGGGNDEAASATDFDADADSVRWRGQSRERHSRASNLEASLT